MLKNLLIVAFIGVIAFILISRKNDFSAPSASTMSNNSVSSDVDSVVDPVEDGLVLDLSGQNLTRVPPHVLERTDLEELDLSTNMLSGALPSEIGRLKKLKILNVSSNEMTGVPAEVGQLTNLEILDLSNNKLTGLPYELGNLKSLKVLNISGNAYSEQDLEVIKRGLPSTVEIIK